jgi:hypothetical protein
MYIYSQLGEDDLQGFLKHECRTVYGKHRLALGRWVMTRNSDQADASTVPISNGSKGSTYLEVL